VAAKQLSTILAWWWSGGCRPQYSGGYQRLAAKPCWPQLFQPKRFRRVAGSPPVSN